MRSGLLRASLLILFYSAISFAAPPRRPTAPSPPRNPPRVLLTLTTPSVNTWKLRVENTGEVPLRLIADARLLSLEITPPSGKPLRCALPADARPASDNGAAVVFLPKMAFTATIDPRFYCLHQTEGLVAGSKVVAHFGWLAMGRTITAPFVIAPIAEGGTSPAVGGDPPVSPAKEIVGAAITLDENAAAKTPPVASAEKHDVRLDITLTPRVDAARPGDLAATVSVTNSGVRASTFLFRPQTLGFDVVGPTGVATRCGNAGESAGIRELFTTLAPNAKTSVSILPSALCPDRTFERPGVYEVRPRLDTRQASGRSLGLHTFDDVIVGAPSLVRIRQDRINGALRTPTLERTPEQKTE